MTYGIDQPGSHADHLLRQTRMYHTQLVGMADMKANMLLTTAAVVLTLSASYTLNEEFQLPALILSAGCMITIVLAAFSSMPRIFPFRREQNKTPDSPLFNLLFFGDFQGMDYDQFSSNMRELVRNPEAAYESQIRDIYVLGMFLGKRKYRYLRYAYFSFLTGLLSSGAALGRILWLS